MSLVATEPRLSEALDRLKIKVTKEEKQEETTSLVQSSGKSVFQMANAVQWPNISEQVRQAMKDLQTIKFGVDPKFIKNLQNTIQREQDIRKGLGDLY